MFRNFRHMLSLVCLISFSILTFEQTNAQENLKLPDSNQNSSDLTRAAETALQKIIDSSLPQEARLTEFPKLRFIDPSTNKQVAEKLIQVASNKNENTQIRRYAISYLAKLFPESSVDSLSEILETGDSEPVRNAAKADLLYILNFSNEAPGAQTKAENVLKQTMIKDPDGQADLTGYFARKGEPFAVEQCVKAIKDNKHSGLTAASAIKYLTFSDPAKVRYDALLPGLESDDPVVRRLAIVAVGPHPQSRDKIRSLYTNKNASLEDREKAASVLAKYDESFPDTAIQVLNDDGESDYIKDESIKQIQRAVREGAFKKTESDDSPNWTKLKEDLESFKNKINSDRLLEGTEKLLREFDRGDFPGG